mmetsp:Transcript_44885/g.65984  ORF Transcript_44885/g.65984 Transcript_44885/m.65984 type:complete len:211 (+) Transcript_44885:168-800(+)|eukprot:CAMPEP_0195521366 /NCGR_PEP_ID=MMETSP0794_2-20130614/18544_1 /TAXON_ID=515487 /ORGANISM="Stephanopyxis turris, Strain CCMP 815" /LENGTH=210 /DNA_ID=CAMNT_0040650903 /DNA_START=166 /DNA_END=798 /DNA_ORIENTATION=-
MIGVKTKKKKAKKDKKSKSSGDGERKTAAELRVIRDTEMDFKHLPAQLIQLYLPDPSCYLTIVARVTCETGYWKGIPFMFHINFPCDKPNDYPMVPPKCRLAPGYKIYHPNVDLDGAVCLGLRKPGAWKPVMDLKYILLGLLTILQDPNPLDPLNHEASRLLRDAPDQFGRNVMLSILGRDVRHLDERVSFPSAKEMQHIQVPSTYKRIF